MFSTFFKCSHIGVRAGGARGAAVPPVTDVFEIFWAKVLGRKLSERLSKPDLKTTFSHVCLVKTELRSNDRTIQVICFVKAMYRLHVFRRNP